MKILIAIMMFLPLLLNADDRARERENMVNSQIMQRGVSDGATLEAMRNVKRHLYIPLNQTRRAYSDSPLPIGFGQTISQPYIVAYMTEALSLSDNYKVLEIGTGSGYQAAVLAEIVAEVYTIEIVPELKNNAEIILTEKYDNVFVKDGDGYYGWEENAPFDAIIVTAAAETIPPPLIEQLKDGGKMIIPVGSPFMVQDLMLVEKIDGRISTKSLMSVRFVPFTRE